MAVNASSRIWQDVYRVPFRGVELYVKLMIDAEGKLLISFKRR